MLRGFSVIPPAKLRCVTNSVWQGRSQRVLYMLGFVGMGGVIVLARLYTFLLTIIIVLWAGVLLVLDAALGRQGRDGSLRATGRVWAGF